MKETFQSIFCFCFKLQAKFHQEKPITSEEEQELDKEITDLYMKLYYLLANIRSYELSPSLSQLLFQIGKILMLNDQKSKVSF